LGFLFLAIIDPSYFGINYKIDFNFSLNEKPPKN
jgi:hypothetical protein